jgi:hypothetical protein
MKRAILVFSFLFLAKISYGSDSSIVNYFPLKVGNVFVYNYVSNSGTSIIKASVTYDTVINGLKYFHCTGFPSYYNGLIRFDSVSGCIYKIDNCRLDSFRCVPGTVVYNILCSNQLYKAYAYPDTQILFNQTVNTKYFHHTSIITGGAGWKYAYNFGLIFYETVWKWVYNRYYLKGCVINGIVYGDTSTTPTNINLISSIAHGYELKQNYPNPFNPTTKILFSIKDANSNVSLKVYNLEGKEISTLINKSLNTGEYQEVFNGSNLTSGIYFYRLTVNGNIIDTKKMVLLK